MTNNDIYLKLARIFGMASAFTMLNENTNEPKATLIGVKKTGEMLSDEILSLIRGLNE